MQQRFLGKGLTILAVHIGETQARVQQFMAEKKYTFAALVDVDGKVAKKYNVTGHPHTLLIGPQGELLGFTLGPKEWVSSSTLSFFDGILNSRPPTTRG